MKTMSKATHKYMVEKLREIFLLTCAVERLLVSLEDPCEHVLSMIEILQANEENLLVANEHVFDYMSVEKEVNLREQALLKAYQVNNVTLIPW